MKDKSRSLTENSNCDSRIWNSQGIADDGIAESRRWDSRRIQSRTKSSCAAFSRTLWIGRRDQMRGLKTRMSRSIRYYKVVFSILYSFQGLHIVPLSNKPWRCNIKQWLCNAQQQMTTHCNIKQWLCNAQQQMTTHCNIKQWLCNPCWPITTFIISSSCIGPHSIQ